MASLRKKALCKYWYACFTLPDGRRVQRSTRQTKRSEAKAMAEEWERLSKEKARARQAHKVIADIYKAAHSSDLPDATIRTFVVGWLARRKGEVAPASFRSYKARTTHFLDWLGEKADNPLAELETRQFVAYRDEVAKTRSASTANHGIKVLRGVFEDARRDGYISENPAKDCGLLKTTRGTGRRAFTIDELRKVLVVAQDEWRSMVLFGLYTGQRISDLARLGWNNVDLVAKEIHLVTSKTGRTVRIPICGPLMNHLDSLPAGDDPRAPLHPHLAALASVNSSTLSRQFREILADAGLVEKQTHEKAGQGRDRRRATSELSFHSLRHTATSMMKNAGVSPAIVQDIIGHDSAEISAHYTHIESEAKQHALNKLPNLLNP